MKAAFIERFGGPEVLKYGELPVLSRGRARWSSMWLPPASTSAADAHRLSETRHVRGKLVFLVR